MKVAVTYEDGRVFQHFGKTEKFKLYQVEEDQVKSSEVVDTNGTGHSALADFLKENKVEVLICGGIGGCAQRALAEAQIKVYPGVQGETDQAVEALAKGSLTQNAQATCNHHHEGGHHHHGEGHESCGHHHHHGEGHHCGK